MKKSSAFLLIAIFIVLVSVIVVTLVLATHTASPSSLKFTDPRTQLSFTLTPPDNNSHSYAISFPTITQDDGTAITFSSSDLTNVVSSRSVTITANNVNYGKLSPGKNYNGNIILLDSNNNSDTLTVPLSFVGSFCKQGEKGADLEVTKVDIDNSDGDDDEWSPLDEIEIKVEVSNEGDEKIKEINVELGLFDSDGKNIIKDMENLDSEEIDLGSIKDDDEDTAVFNFKVPADFEDGDYRLVVKAFSKDLREENLCTARSTDLDNEFFQLIDGAREDNEEKHIVLDNIKVSPSPAQCGERIQITGELVNIGDADYEDQVKVTLSNTELELNLEQIVRENFDQGDSEMVDFEFDVPQQIEEKSYVLDFVTYYDYDEDDNTYDIHSEDTFTTSIKIAGNCEREVKNVQITAQLDSETPQAVAGKQVIVNSVLKNTGDVETVYTVSVFGNSQWSVLNSVDPQIFTLAPGESKDVSIVLTVNEDAEGENEFTIKASYNGQETEQKVALSIASSYTKDVQLTPFLETIRANWFIYLIILVNIILIIAIILVIRSMVSPRSL